MKRSAHLGPRPHGGKLRHVRGIRLAPTRKEGLLHLRKGIQYERLIGQAVCTKVVCQVRVVVGAFLKAHGRAVELGDVADLAVMQDHHRLAVVEERPDKVHS